MSADRRRVVVGIDNVDRDLMALRWAVTEAAMLGAPLSIIHAYGCYLPGSERVSAGRPMSTLAQATAAASSVIDEAVRRVRELNPDVLVSGEAVEDDPASALRREAHETQMIVLGSRRLGGLGSFLLGSIGQAVAERAGCPVIVVRGEPHAEAGARVVVGVDSEEDAVLSFAFEHARRHHADLEAVVCWQPDLMSAASLLEEAAEVERATVAQLLNQTLQPWQHRFPEVSVTHTVLESRPVTALVAAAANQQLLVVGRRGSHPVSGPLLGAVNIGVLHHCRCPVAIVPVATAGRPTDSASASVPADPALI